MVATMMWLAIAALCFSVIHSVPRGEVKDEPTNLKVKRSANEQMTFNCRIKIGEADIWGNFLVMDENDRVILKALSESEKGAGKGLWNCAEYECKAWNVQESTPGRLPQCFKVFNVDSTKCLVRRRNRIVVDPNEKDTQCERFVLEKQVKYSADVLKPASDRSKVFYRSCPKKNNCHLRSGRSNMANAKTAEAQIFFDNSSRNSKESDKGPHTNQEGDTSKIDEKNSSDDAVEEVVPENTKTDEESNATEDIDEFRSDVYETGSIVSENESNANKHADNKSTDTVDERESGSVQQEKKSETEVDSSSNASSSTQLHSSQRPRFSSFKPLDPNEETDVPAAQDSDHFDVPNPSSGNGITSEELSANLGKEPLKLDVAASQLTAEGFQKFVEHVG
ncbi:unnamed protein product [Clavelina lepadiformis]|uniref:Uncharacterized protein n=1 Tax=Clavelina lepadiformis TaxID=159417 RepID=A0ABP0GZN4_CLALP